MKKISDNFSIPVSAFFSVFASALLLALAFPFFDIGLLAWIALVPFIRRVKEMPCENSPALGMYFGWAFYAFSLYWIYNVTITGMVALILYLSLYPACFAFILKKTILSKSAVSKPKKKRWVPKPLYNAMFAASVWVLLEYVQAHLLSGFGWMLLGYSQYKNLMTAQFADVFGVYGISFLIVTFNFLVAELLDEVRDTNVNTVKKIPRGIKRSFVYMGVILLAVNGYGYYRVRSSYLGQRVNISLIQGNIPQEEKWDEEFAPFIMSKYRALSKMAALANPDLIVWPETATPGYLNEKLIRGELEALSRDTSTPLLTGTPYYNGIGDDRKYFNAAVLVSPDKEIKMYKKLHLVPFGEFVPFGSVFKRFFIPENMVTFTKGDEYTLFSLNKASARGEVAFGVMICFEDIFPGIARRFVKEGAGFLVNITNDAWFSYSSAPYQHTACSVFRAIENKKWVVRAANTGVSCYISPVGEVVKYLQDFNGRKIFETIYSTFPVSANNRRTFYTAFGDVWLVPVLLFLILATRRRYQVPKSKP